MKIEIKTGADDHYKYYCGILTTGSDKIEYKLVDECTVETTIPDNYAYIYYERILNISDSVWQLKISLCICKDGKKTDEVSLYNEMLYDPGLTKFVECFFGGYFEEFFPDTTFGQLLIGLNKKYSVNSATTEEFVIASAIYQTVKAYKITVKWDTNENKYIPAPHTSLIVGI